MDMNEEKNPLPASEAAEITDAMSILEAEPARDSEHREKLAFLVASGKTKEMIGAKQSEDLTDSSHRGAGLQPEPELETSLSFSLTQILSVASVALSLARLYYRRKELMALINKPKPQAQPLQTQIPVRVKQIDLFFCLLK